MRPRACARRYTRADFAGAGGRDAGRGGDTSVCISAGGRKRGKEDAREKGRREKSRGRTAERGANRFRGPRRGAGGRGRARRGGAAGGEGETTPATARLNANSLIDWISQSPRVSILASAFSPAIRVSVLFITRTGKGRIHRLATLAPPRSSSLRSSPRPETRSSSVLYPRCAPSLCSAGVTRRYQRFLFPPPPFLFPLFLDKHGSSAPRFVLSLSAARLFSPARLVPGHHAIALVFPFSLKFLAKRSPRA